ncbi:MAG: hypothetical protein NTW21_15385 [Verrucomicrobia bacterium]|nr:hypothetical protein [Verrucomicrobiota bacterium]
MKLLRCHCHAICLVGKERIDLVPYIVDSGSAILIIDRASARAFRYAMPQ